jgi:hypothetical protein
MQPNFRDRVSQRVIEEPLSISTDSRRKQLLWLASIALLVSIFKLEITGSQWLDFKVPGGAVNIEGALAIALIYSLLQFLFHALQDLRRWFLLRDMMYLFSYSNNLLHAKTSLATFLRAGNEGVFTGKVGKFRATLIDAQKFLEKAESAITKANTSYVHMEWLQYVRVGLDVAVPLAVGTYALYRTSDSIGPLLAML